VRRNWKPQRGISLRPVRVRETGAGEVDQVVEHREMAPSRAFVIDIPRESSVNE